MYTIPCYNSNNCVFLEHMLKAYVYTYMLTTPQPLNTYVLYFLYTHVYRLALAITQILHMQPDEVKMISDKWHLSSSSSHNTTPGNNSNTTGAVGAVINWWNTPKKAATPIIMTPLDKTKNNNSYSSNTTDGKKMADYDPYSPTNAYP